jgi:hypothetical protein
MTAATAASSMTTAQHELIEVLDHLVSVILLELHGVLNTVIFQIESELVVHHRVVNHW